MSFSIIQSNQESNAISGGKTTTAIRNISAVELTEIPAERSRIIRMIIMRESRVLRAAATAYLF